MSQPTTGVPPHSWGAAYQPGHTRLAPETLLFSIKRKNVDSHAGPQNTRTKLDAKRKYSP